MATDLKYKYGKYENYIRVGEVGKALSSLPTPSAVAYAYRDLDKDPFTDLEGYTHRNRVRHDVLQLEISWEALGEDDVQQILDAIGPVWIDLECLDKHTKQKAKYKMYASDKEFGTFRVWKDDSGNWHEISNAFTVTFTQE